MTVDSANKKTCPPRPTVRSETKYREAVELYGSTGLSCREICRICGLTPSGLSGHIGKYHRHLMLARYDIACDSEQALHIKMGGLRGQRPATRAKYRKAIEACERMEHLEKNLSEFAGRFGVDGSGLARQLRTHYPGVLERREAERLRLGYDDRLPRGSRRCCREQYADAVELLRADRYVTVREAAESCGVSCSGLEQHLLFYHKELVARRIGIRKQAVGQQRKGEITGRGSTHAPSPAIVQKYAEALRLYRPTPQSAARIARQTNVSKKGFYAYLQKWHRESICERKNIPCEEGRPVDWSKTRKYNPATKAKYAGAIRHLKENNLSTAAVAAIYGLHAECFRSYLKEHEPELYARQGMVKDANGRMVSRRSMEKYAEAIRVYETTPESLKSIAHRFGLNDCSFRDFIKRHFPELEEQHKRLFKHKEMQRAGVASASEMQVGTEESVHVLVIS